MLATGNNQTPWLNDNADDVPNTPSDGAIASTRYLATNFGVLLPRITATGLNRVGSTGTISATVEPGDQLVKTVWAAVYAPSFQEPVGTTLDLGVPLVQLWPSADLPNVYAATYNAFTEAGDYRIIIYAADNDGNQAVPKLVGRGQAAVYLPMIVKAGAATAR